MAPAPPERADRPPASALPVRFVAGAAEAPASPGAYLLPVMLAAPLHVALPRGRDVLLQPGRYLYAGSARGPGGMRARLARHQRADKTPHWHIDRLTMAGAVLGAWIFPGGSECAIVAALGHLPVPLPGFGSSDCRRCASHLLAWPDGVGIALPDAGPVSWPGQASRRRRDAAVCHGRPCAGHPRLCPD